MTTFATTFREIVCPDLARRCRSRGLFVALGLDSWSEAYDAIVTEARDRGARHLPDAINDQLEDWIATQLLKAIDAAQPTIQETDRHLDRTEAYMVRAWQTNP